MDICICSAGNVACSCKCLPAERATGDAFDEGCRFGFRLHFTDGGDEAGFFDDIFGFGPAVDRAEKRFHSISFLFVFSHHSLFVRPWQEKGIKNRTLDGSGPIFYTSIPRCQLSPTSELPFFFGLILRSVLTACCFSGGKA